MEKGIADDGDSTVADIVCIEDDIVEGRGICTIAKV